MVRFEYSRNNLFSPFAGSWSDERKEKKSKKKLEFCVEEMGFLKEKEKCVIEQNLYLKKLVKDLINERHAEVSAEHKRQQLLPYCTRC